MQYGRHAADIGVLYPIAQLQACYKFTADPEPKDWIPADMLLQEGPLIPRSSNSRLILVVFVLAALTLGPCPLLSQVVTTTLCEIHRNPAKYRGKMVRVGAPYYSGHGTALVDEGCPELKTDGEIVPPGIDVTVPWVKEDGEKPVGFSLDQMSWEAFVSFQGTLKRFEPVLVTFIGQIRVKRRFHLKEFGGGLAGNGYGTRGLYRLQIVVQSVEHFARMKGALR
jgi:hypothetical protein